MKISTKFQVNFSEQKYEKVLIHYSRLPPFSGRPKRRGFGNVANHLRGPLTEMISDAKNFFLDTVTKQEFFLKQEFSSFSKHFFLSAQKKSCAKKKMELTLYQEKNWHQKRFF